jgi:glycosyltransferase involved in cell wall biosynthesis
VKALWPKHFSSNQQPIMAEDSLLLESRDTRSAASIDQSPRTLRVLHLVNGEHYAGAERVQDLLALRLPEFDVDVTLACVKPGVFARSRRSQATLLINLPMRGRFDVRPAWRLAKIIRAQRFDLIHTHTPRTALIGQMAARLAGVPMVHHVHGQTATEVGRGWMAWLAAQTERRSICRAAAVIAVSSSAAEYIHVWGVPKNRIQIVPNGVPAGLHLFDRPAPSGEWTIGTIALFRPRKGLEVLLEAVAELERRKILIRLRAIGGFESPQYQEQVRQLAVQLGIAERTEWLGFRRDVETQLDALDLMILPSLLPEGMPMVVLEAMAAGVPPIGSRVPGIADVITHGQNGLLTEPANPVALADAVESVVLGEVEWCGLRRHAIATHAEKYSDHAMAEGVAEIYRRVLSQ